MTAFIISSLVLFFLSLVSNILFVLNENTTFKGGAVVGLIIFTSMLVWGSLLLFQ
jgi:hypothetical protein